MSELPDRRPGTEDDPPSAGEWMLLAVALSLVIALVWLVWSAL